MEITYLILNQMFLFLLLKLLKQFQTNLDQAQLKTITMVFLWKQQIDQHPNLILKFRFYLSLLFLMTSQKFYSFEETILLQEFILFHIKFITNAHRFVVSFFFMSETHLPLQWCYAMGFFILKTKPPPLNIKDFQSIALLNVEGKLFFSPVSKHYEKHHQQQFNWYLCSNMLLGKCLWLHSSDPPLFF